jgi:aryl-alcohol dehydrogenase-like predicted oxidoreductase
MTRGIEADILPTIRELGIALVAYGVLSRGLISDGAARSQGAGEIRTRMPRFSPDNFPRNLALVEALRAIAQHKGVSTAQLAFAWVRSRGDDIFPLIGARRRDQLHEALGALAIELAATDIAWIEQAVPPDAAAGGRYLPTILAHLDSEQRFIN